MAGIQEILEVLSKIPNIYSDLAQPSVKKIGEALETVFDYAGTLLLPLKLKSEKNKVNFEKRLNEYKIKIENIADEKICKVSPEIGVPIIDKLTYITDDDIADLFTTLLAKASSIDTINQAHPGFVQLLDRLSGDEAKIIKCLNHNIGFIPFINIHGNIISGSGYHILAERLTDLPFITKLIFPNNILAYYSNFIGMGIFEVPFGEYKTDDDLYKSILSHHNLSDYDSIYNKQKKFKDIELNKGYFNITNYGKLFIKACNINN